MKKIFYYLKSSQWIKRFFLWSFALLAIFILLLSAMVSTQSGSRWVVTHAAQMANVQLGSFKGNLLTGLDIVSLDWNKNELHIHAEKISFRWQPLALFYTAVSVQSFSAEKIRVQLPATKEAENVAEPEHYNWPSLALPLRIELGGLKLHDIQVQQDNKEVLLNSINGSLSLGTFHLRINDLVVDNQQFNIATKGTMDLRYPYNLDIKSQWQYKTEAQNIAPSSRANMSGEAKISGDIKKITVVHNLKQPLLVTSTATIKPALHSKKQKPDADIISEWSQQDLPPAPLEDQNKFLKEILTTQGHLQITGWLDSYTIQGTTTEKTIESQLTTDINIKGTRNAATPSEKSSMMWQFEKVIISNEPLINIPDDPHNNSLQNSYSQKSYSQKNYLQLAGNIKWSPAINWDLTLHGEHFNTGQLFADWPSDLQINIATTGEFKNQQDFSAPNWRATISQLNIQGELRGLHLETQGTVNFDGSQWQSSNINIALGANQLYLKGKAGKDLVLEWNINAPLLNQIDPGVNGSVISSGFFNAAAIDNNNTVNDKTKVGNDKTKTKMQMNAQINHFSWRGYSADKLILNLQSKVKDIYQLTLDADHLQLQEQRISSINIKGDGSVAQHNLTGVLQSPTYGTLDFGLDGTWKNKLWQGKWRNLSMLLKKIPRWYLSSSSIMQADQSHFELGRLCLTTAGDVTVETQSMLNQNLLPHSNVDANVLDKLTGKTTAESDVATQESPRICIASKWNSGADLLASVSAVAVPLRQAQAWFKPEVTLAGVVDAQLLLQAAANHPLSVEAHLQTRSAQLIYQFHGGNTEVYPLKEGKLDATLKNNMLYTSLVMDWGKYGVINADNKYTIADKKIQGKLSASLPDLAPLESLLPSLDDIHGAASAAIIVQGTIDNPAVTGNLTLSNGSANVPKLGLELKEISLQLASQEANLIHVNGQLLSGDGRLMLKGEIANIGAENWQCHGNIFGNGIRIIQQTQLSATISPNLTFTADTHAINLNGSTEIPWARTAIKTLPASATRASNDVTILESENYGPQQRAEKTSIPFYTNVILYFGDDVRFKGFGLDGQLTGKINVLKEQNRQTLTTGFVAINNGIYKAYGQELTIERGRLIFQGPYDNPGLDIRAIRTIETATSAGQAVVAGLEIGGTLQHPKSTVFAIPTLEDSKAMALLVTGKALDQLSTGDAYLIIAAMSSMGVENESSITADIAHFFRLDEITIKADKGLDQSSLWMGKYITPRLFVRYVVGLFDQTFTLGMRYQITNKLRIEVESGKTQSVDVIYKIEH